MTGRLFYLVQKLKKRARRRHHVVVRCMEEGLDRVFRWARKQEVPLHMTKLCEILSGFDLHSGVLF